MPAEYFRSLAHLLIVKARRADREESRIIGQRFIDLIPGDSPRHHDIGRGVGFRKHVFDLLAGFDVPFRHIMLSHLLLPLGSQAFPFPDLLHDHERHLRVKSLADQVNHDVVTAADGGRDRAGPAHNQVLGVAQPDVGSVRKTGDPDQVRQVLRFCVDQHLDRKFRSELRDSQGSQRTAADILRFYAEGIRVLEQGHHLPVVQRNVDRPHPGQVLQHPDHGRIIMAQDIQLQQVVIDLMIVKMRRDGILILRGMLNRREGVDLLPVGKNNDAARMLPCRLAHVYAAVRDPDHLRRPLVFPVILKILFHISERRLVRDARNRAGPEGLSGPEDHLRIFVGLGLIFP